MGDFQIRFMSSLIVTRPPLGNGIDLWAFILMRSISWEFFITPIMYQTLWCHYGNVVETSGQDPSATATQYGETSKVLQKG